MIAAKVCLVLVVGLIIADSGVLGHPKGKKSARSKSAKQEDHHSAGVEELKADMKSAVEQMNPEAVQRMVHKIQDSARGFMNSPAGQRAITSVNKLFEQVLSRDLNSRIMKAEGQARAAIQDPASSSKAAKVVNKSMSDIQSAIAGA